MIKPPLAELENNFDPGPNPDLKNKKSNKSAVVDRMREMEEKRVERRRKMEEERMEKQ